MKFFRNIKGLILAETLVAVAILGTAAIILAGIIQSGVAAAKVSRDYLVAQNLLQEGAEVVKALRNTNLRLRPADVFPGAEGCWLFLNPGALVQNANLQCDVNVVLGDTSYIYRYENGQLRLEEMGGILDLTEAEREVNGGYRLKLVEGVYEYGEAGVESKFYREIRFLEVAADKSKARFEVKVQWKDGGKVRNVKRDFLIYNLF